MLGRVYDEPKDDDKNFIEKRYDYYKNGYLSFSPSEKRFAKETNDLESVSKTIGEEYGKDQIL